jgi:hypothetical protein
MRIMIYEQIERDGYTKVRQTDGRKDGKMDGYIDKWVIHD